MEALRRCGFQVIDLHNLGGGCPDVLVAHPQSRENLLVEIKGEKGTLTEDQQKFMETWPGRVLVARDYQEVLRYFGLVK